MCLILHFLPISLDGVAEDDFTLVLVIQEPTVPPSVAIEQIVKRQSCKIEIRDKALK
jgi:hypothetical protein